MIGVANKMENLLNKIPQVGVIQRPSFLSKGLRLPKKLDLQRTHLVKSVVRLATMPIFSSMLEVLN